MTAAIPLVFSVAIHGHASQTPLLRSGQVYARLPGLGTTMPQVVEQPLPAFPAEAVNAHVRAIREIEVIVGTDGSAKSIRVLRSSTNTAELDASAVESIKQWKFRPGTGADRRRTPVPVLVLVQMSFDASGSRTPAVSAKITEVPDRDMAAITPVDSGVVYSLPAPGVKPPELVRQIEPAYTDEAMRRIIQGDMTMDVVIDAEGAVQFARVAKSLDTQFGLDAQAIRAVSHWLFRPAELDGRPVAVHGTVIMSFKLH